jgi:hypothetical protein
LLTEELLFRVSFGEPNNPTTNSLSFRLTAKPAVLGDRIDGWRVCWIGGWDKGKVLFVVMVERVCRRG